LAVGETWLPQLAQTGARAKAHSSQNFAPALFSCWQPGQIIQESRKKSGKRKNRANEGSVRHHWQQVSISGIAQLAKDRFAPGAVVPRYSAFDR
jgi:hypothetical protein